MGKVIAVNLHRLRTGRPLSLAALAARADFAKATLANLEQGRGNPTIETLWSLALALGVAFSDLLEDRRETTTAVVRDSRVRVRGSKAGGTLDLRLLDRLERGGLVEVFDMFLPAGTEYIGKPHGSGVVERVLVHEGTITVGPASDPLTLGPGDFARYGADRLHVYRSADEDSTALCSSDIRPPERPQVPRTGPGRAAGSLGHSRRRPATGWLRLISEGVTGSNPSCAYQVRGCFQGGSARLRSQTPAVRRVRSRRRVPQQSRDTAKPSHAANHPTRSAYHTKRCDTVPRTPDHKASEDLRMIERRYKLRSQKLNGAGKGTHARDKEDPTENLSYPDRLVVFAGALGITASCGNSSTAPASLRLPRSRRNENASE